MADYVRFTPEEYRVLCQASHPMPLHGPFTDRLVGPSVKVAPLVAYLASEQFPTTGEPAADAVAPIFSAGDV